MLIYKDVPVDITYQNFGSAWLIILRGRTELIETVFNGFFNFCATGGELDWQDHTQTVATFWTNRNAMRRFFFNQLYLRGDSINSYYVRASMKYALEQLEELVKHHEAFMRFDNLDNPEAFETGTITAERPDDNMEDSIILDAFKVKGEKPQEDIDTE